MVHPGPETGPASLFQGRAARLPRWRRWLVLFALVCAVSLYSIEATHDHRTAQDQLRCPVCHVVGHNALDTTPPDLTPAAVLVAIFFLALPAAGILPISRRYTLKPQPRAPPASILSLI